MLRDALTRFPTIIHTILRGYVLRPDEVRAILKIAFLTSEIDLDEDPEEIAGLQYVGHMLWELGGYEPEGVPIVSPLPLPIDDEARIARLHELADELDATEPRELAYIVAYLFTVFDLALMPVEGELLEELRRELHIDPIRATELVATAAAMMTPGVADVLQP